MNFLELVEMKKRLERSGFTGFTMEDWRKWENHYRGVDLVEAMAQEIKRLNRHLNAYAEQDAE